MKKKIFSTRVLAEVAIFAALGFALDAFQGGLWKQVFVNGGSIGIAMLPILVISYRRGLLPGLLCGLCLSILQMLGGIYVINSANFSNPFLQVMGPFFQIALDYLLAYTVVGIAGSFAKKYKTANTKKQKLTFLLIGCILGGMLKYMCHTLAGGFFWLSPDVSILGISGETWLYTFVYNGLYSIPNVIICTVLMILIELFYPQFLNENKL